MTSRSGRLSQRGVVDMAVVLDVPSVAARRCGFTLLEVLIALIVFSVSATAILKSISVNLSNEATLNDQVVATWVAQNTADKFRFENPWPSVGEHKVETQMLQRLWRVSIRVEDTDQSGIRRLEISVGTDNSARVLGELQAFVGRN